MQVKKKPKKTAKAVPEKSRKKKQPSEDQIKKQPFLKRMLFGEEKPDLSELEAGSTTILDILSPTTVDTKSRDYIIVDDVYHAYLYITGYGYTTTVGTCWLAPLVEAGEGIMVIRKKGSVFFIDGKEFKIGGGVFANDESEYMGLYGTVTEIRTDEDRETENDTPDIYCEFMSPDSVAMAAELETRFSDLYRQDMQLEEISLDCVIMSPEMLEPVPAREPESIGNQLTLTCLEDQIDHVDGVTLAISNDMGVLLRKMLENLEEYDDPPVLTRVEKTISGFLFAYGGRDNQEDGPCVVYIVSETPVLPAKNKEEMK